MRIFVDTSAFVALYDRDEARHPPAQDFIETLTQADRLWTSNYVVDETITRLRYKIGHGAALTFAESMLKSRMYALLYVDDAMERSALDIFRKYKDKKLSFTDCTTAAFVKDRRFDAVFAFDDDFNRMGLRVVPG